MRKNTYYLVSLGCAKNTVDSESMGILLGKAGFTGVGSPEDAEFLIVNTCGFIQASRDEAYSILSELSENKNEGQYLLAAGCLSERYREKLIDKIKNIDGIMGTRRWLDIVELVKRTRQNKNRSPLAYFPEAEKIIMDTENVPRTAAQGKSAYLKIGDGCRHSCAFCAIPLIKGPAVSRVKENIIRDAKQLQQKGIKEINLIAQDTSDYGADLGLQDGFASLLTELVPQIPDIPWIRLLYAYPGNVSDRLIQVMADSPQVLPYLDIPLQHAHPEILKRMRRPANLDWIYKTLEKMRTLIPELAIRTTFIVGFPGETEKEFNILLDFVKEIRFDHLGAFTYSFEEGTPAEPFGDPVSEEEKLDRLERIMLLQEKISLSKNQQFIGKELKVLVEGYNEGVSVGRSYRDAPEIDGLVFVDHKVKIGEIITVKITDALTHDLIGFPI